MFQFVKNVKSLNRIARAHHDEIQISGIFLTI